MPYKESADDFQQKLKELCDWLQIGAVGEAKKVSKPDELILKRINALDGETKEALVSQIETIYEVVQHLHNMKLLGKYHRFSKGDLSAWWDIVGQNSHRDLITLFPKIPLTEEANKWADKAMTGVYVGLNLLTLALACLACANISDLGKLSFVLTGTTNMAIASTWNYIDVIGGVVQGWHEYMLGNYGRGTAAIISSSQLAACTMAGNIGMHVGTVSAAGFAGLTGFSFAACMYIAMLTELVNAYKIKKKLN